MRRYWFLVVAGAIAAALAVVPFSAFAASAVLTVGSSSGPAVNTGDGLSGALSGNATFTNSSSSSQVVTCTSSGLTATAGSNPASGTATETNSAQTFGTCSIKGVFGATGINSISTNATAACPWNVSVNDGTNPATVTISSATASGCSTSITATVNVQTVIGAESCVYNPTGGSIAGSATIGGTSLVFSGVGFTKSSGPGTCFSAAKFSATYNISDTSQGNGAVVVN